MEILTVRAFPEFGISKHSDKLKVRIFDDDSTLDTTLDPVITDTHKDPPHGTAKQNITASPFSSTKVDEGQGEEIAADIAEKRIKALEKEILGLNLAKDELENNLQSERDLRMAAEKRAEELQGDLQKSKALGARLENT